jgi:hypothetical protein
MVNLPHSKRPLNRLKVPEQVAAGFFQINLSVLPQGIRPGEFRGLSNRPDDGTAKLTKFSRKVETGCDQVGGMP